MHATPRLVLDSQHLTFRNIANSVRTFEISTSYSNIAERAFYLPNRVRQECFGRSVRKTRFLSSYFASLGHRDFEEGGRAENPTVVRLCRSSSFSESFLHACRLRDWRTLPV